MRKKVIIIGGGVGGLSGAIRLARMGYDVHLYEQNKTLGGKMGQIHVDGYKFDTGPTLLTMPFVLEDLFQYAGYPMSDYIQLIATEPICRYFFNDTKPFDASSDRQIMLNNIEHLFHGETTHYVKFLQYAERIYRKTASAFIFSPIHEIRKIFKWQHLMTLLAIHQIDPFRTVHRSVTRFFQDPRLVQLFDRYPTYNGSNPYSAPATLNVIPYVELGLGGYYIKGGMYQLIESMAQMARQMHVRINTETKVERILHDYHRVNGIQIRGEKIDADIILCNGDVVTTYQDLIRGFQKTQKKLNRLEPSLSGMIFFWGIQRQVTQLKQHNIIFSDNYEKEFEQIFDDRLPPNDPTIYISISSKQDPDHAPAGCENWFVLINMPYLTKGQENETWNKNRIRDKIMQKLKRFGMDISGKIQYERTITPLDIADQFHSNRGSIYGISSNTMHSAFRRPPNRSRQLRGLYFAGGSTHPGGGVPLCMLSGKFAAELIHEFEGH